MSADTGKNEARQLRELVGAEMGVRQSAAELKKITGKDIFSSERIAKILTYHELALIAVYTSEEIAEQIKFYSSPIGQAVLRKAPIISRIMMRAGSLIGEGQEPPPPEALLAGGKP